MLENVRAIYVVSRSEKMRIREEGTFVCDILMWVSASFSPCKWSQWTKSFCELYIRGVRYSITVFEGILLFVNLRHAIWGTSYIWQLSNCGSSCSTKVLPKIASFGAKVPGKSKQMIPTIRLCHTFIRIMKSSGEESILLQSFKSLWYELNFYQVKESGGWVQYRCVKHYGQR